MRNNLKVCLRLKDKPTTRIEHEYETNRKVNTPHLFEITLESRFVRKPPMIKKVKLKILS